MRKKQYAALLILALITIPLSGALASCANTTSGSASVYQIAPVNTMPDEVQDAPPVVLEAYQFAVVNPEMLQQLPCFCGCGDMGHTSNYSCYVQNQTEGGEITIDNHALGCSICVDITQDAIRLIKEGRALPEIRAYVDETYAQYGPSNIPVE